MGKDRFLKELSLSAEVAEAGDAKMEAIIGDSESVDRKPSPPAVENSDAIERESEVPDNAKESTEYPTEQLLAEERVTEQHGQHTEI